MNKTFPRYSKRIGVTLILILLTISACQKKEGANSQPIGHDDRVATIVAATISAYSSLTLVPTETPISTETPIGSNIYVNESYGFSFEYPSTWNVKETIIPKGTHLFERTFHRFDAGSDDYEEIIVEASKGSEWILEITARKSIQNCGGYSQDFLEIFANSSNYQSLEILGRNAVRLRPEEGYAWKVPDGPEPYPVIVAFPDQIEECPGHDEEWVLFGVSDNQMPLSLAITYYSSQFTDVNLQNRTIDYSVILEMDRIAESLRLLK